MPRVHSIVSAGIVLLAVACKSTTSAGVKDASSYQEAAPAKQSFQCNTMAPNWHEAILTKYGPTCDTLVSKYPMLNADEPPEDKRVICPFIRLVNRTGRFKDLIAANLARKDADPKWVLPITLKDIDPILADIGLAIPEDMYGSPGGVAAGQLGLGQPVVIAAMDKYEVDIGRLTESVGVSHNCGYNFALNDHEVKDSVRNASLAKLKALATAEGHISYDALQALKVYTCKRDYDLYMANTSQRHINDIDTDNKTFVQTKAEIIEGLIVFMYLGGVENGYVMYDDVDRFFHGKMPANKTKYLLTKELTLSAITRIGKEKLLSAVHWLFAS